jgi:cytochrome P450
VAGVGVKEGDMVIPLWGAGGYDATQFPEPQTFDIDRPNVRRHMGFGHGPHFCPGAELARLEARIAFEMLLTRLPGMYLDAEQSDLSHLPSFASRGYNRVVLRFDSVS